MDRRFREAPKLELKDYVRLLRRHWKFLVVGTFIGLLTASTYTLTMSPVYSAKTQLFVSIQSSGSITELQQGNAFSQARVKSYVQAARTPAVLQPVIDNLGLETTPADLAQRITANADLNTVMITIVAEDNSPVQAAAIAEATGQSLITAVQALEQTSDDLPSAVKLSTVTPAIAPNAPSSPNTKINLFIGLVVGLVAGIVAAVVRMALDTRIKGEADVRKISDSSILGGIAYDDDAQKKPLITQIHTQSPRAESFRQIRTNLQFANVNSRSKTMLVTSSLPGEGKSTTATNMAIAMAQAGMRVALIDADLRRPMIASYLGLEGGAGLTTVLIGNGAVDDLLQPWGEDELFVLTSGTIPPNPSELLGSTAMSEMIQKLEVDFDAIIIDAPPLIPVTDASVLAQKVGGVALVVGAGKVKSSDVEKSLLSLNLVNANILGIALNLLPTSGPDAYAYSYYSYASMPEQGAKNRATSDDDSTGSQRKMARRARRTNAI